MKLNYYIIPIILLAGCETYQDKESQNSISKSGNGKKVDTEICKSYALQHTSETDLALEMFRQCMKSKGYVKVKPESLAKPIKNTTNPQSGSSTLSRNHCTQILIEGEKIMDRLVPLAEFCLNGSGVAAAVACREAAELDIEWSPFGKEAAKCFRAGYAEPPGSKLYDKVKRYRAITDILISKHNS